MELSQEGLAAAKITREAAKKRHNEQAAAADAQHEDKKPRPTPRELPPVSHEVAFPPNYDRSKSTLDPEHYGKGTAWPYSLHTCA